MGMPIFRPCAFIMCFLEFTGSYIHTKSGDEKCHGRDGKLRLTSGPQLGRGPFFGGWVERRKEPGPVVLFHRARA